MQSFNWNNFKVQQIYTDKLYFKKFHYKLEVATHLAPYLRPKNSSLTVQAIKDYVTRFRRINYNYGGAWHYIRGYNETVVASNDDDINEVIAIGNVIRSFPDLKYTIVDTSINIFSDDEQQLLDIAARIQVATGRLGFYAGIWMPDPKTRQAVTDGYEILSKDPGYSHRIELRDRLIGYEVKHQLYNYLLSLGDQVRMTPGVERMFRSRGGYLYAAWFRTSDTSITSFMELMCPGVVRNIIPVYVKNK